MKRYNVANFGRTSDGMEEDSYGRFVLHSEAQARIAELNDLIRRLYDALPAGSNNPEHPKLWKETQDYLQSVGLWKSKSALENSNEPR